MRRKDKYILKSAATGFFVTCISDIVLQWIELKNINQNFTWAKYDCSRTLKRSVFGAAVGAGLGSYTFKCKMIEEVKQPFNPDSYLIELLKQENIRFDQNAFKEIQSARKKIKSWLWEEFRSELVHTPEDAGSFFKRTAIISNFDLDIILPFKKRSFRSLEEMYYTVYDVINSEFGQNGNVTKQSKTIGLSITQEDSTIHFDIAPGREIKNYKIDHDLNLYVRPDWVWQKGKKFKTNTTIQRRITVNNPKARDVIKLLKKYKNDNKMQIPSTILEQYTVDALSEKKFYVSHSVTENLLNVMHYISNKITQNSLMDVANSNNNLHDKIDYLERKKYANKLKSDVEFICANSKNLKEVLY